MKTDLDTLITQSDPLSGYDVPNGDSSQAQTMYAQIVANLNTSTPRWVRPRRMRFSVVGAAFVSLLVVAVLILAQATSPVTAEAALANVADVAARQPDASLAAGQWLHSVRRGLVRLGFSSVNGLPSPGAEATVTETLETWVGSDGTVAYREQFGDPQFASPAARAAWSSADLPPTFASHSVMGAEQGPDGSSAALNVTALPTDSNHLAVLLAQGRTGIPRIDSVPPGPSAVGERILLLLVGPDVGASSAFYSALYQVLSTVSGIERLGTVATHSGNSGAGFALSGTSQGNTVMVVNPASGAPMEVQNLYGGVGSSATVYVQAPIDQILNQVPEPRTLSSLGPDQVALWIDAPTTNQVVDGASLPAGLIVP